MGHLSVSRVVHKAVVEVAKNGTIGGAATGKELFNNFLGSSAYLARNQLYEL